MDLGDKQIAKEIRNAIKTGNIETVIRSIKGSKERLDMMTPFGTWLHVAASFGNLGVIKFLVDEGIDIDRRGGVFNGAAIKEAASEGHLGIVEYLLSQGAELDLTEPERNPLFGAIHGGHTSVAKLLIDRGINTDVKYSGDVMKEMDALQFARQWGRSEIVELLNASR